MKNEKLKGAVIPIISVLLGLILGGIIMLAFSYNPIEGYTALLQGSLGSVFYFGETLRQATPLILVALGFSVAKSAGFFNIGVAGQLVIGWLGSVMMALMFPTLPSFILIPLCVLAGILLGALWAGIAGALRAYFGTSEVIVTIMLNYSALYLTNHIIRNVLTKSDDTTKKISENASLRSEALTTMTDYSTIHMGIVIALLMCIVSWILMKKTIVGFELRSVGLNPFAAEYAGMSAKKNIILAMLISGGLAGLGGAMEGLGNFQNIFVMSSLPGTGFDGMAVALLGNGQPLGILLSGILFGALKVGGVSMPMASGVPTEVVDIVIASIIFFVGASYLIRHILDLLEKRKKKAILQPKVNAREGEAG
ncbi:ABC transporter permease [Enterococcus rivorum]|uniref:Branched-chain amino acid ABC transporter permease n=1 Tax=Enterococcus rivorum TaxID=762845 RepID=A0A1E5KYU7_9ENTE|nr:ABC transporter permease [Enterococcus rivorum]MBP2097616.1 simple sugar transport system permease protein [Enterococcus rivorum]OEH83062.1 branched-chain amino acid ABC transporter permease [Enterococcus rivorum]